MRRRAQSLSTALALAFVLWFVFSRLRFVVFINLPWWGFLLMIGLLFLVVDYIFDSLFRRSP